MGVVPGLRCLAGQAAGHQEMGHKVVGRGSQYRRARQSLEVPWAVQEKPQGATEGFQELQTDLTPKHLGVNCPVNSTHLFPQTADHQYMEGFKYELEAFKERVRGRAKLRIEKAMKEYEEEERKKRLGPGGLDPVEVYESLPEVRLSKAREEGSDL